MITAASEYPFLEIVATLVVVLAFTAWFATVIAVLGDLSRRHDISGWGKAGWMLVIIVIPILGVLFYVGAYGKEMAERLAAAQQARKAEADEYIRGVAGSGGGGGVAAEIAQAKQLLESGTIDQAEFDAIKRKALV